MKIAVVGCGAVGSFYGARLCRAGHEVHFLSRSDYGAVCARGVRVQSPEGDFHAHPHCALSPEAIGPAELVLIGLKTTANDQFPCLLPPLLGPTTAVLTLQNGLGNEAQLARVVGPERVLGGLCFVCLNRVAPGVIHHSAHGRIVLGEYERPPSARTQAVAEVLRSAGVSCVVADDLERAHWEKLVWNVPFNGLGVAGAAGYEAVCAGHRPAARALGPCLTTDRLLAEERWTALVRDLMLEVIATANARHLGLATGLAEYQLTRTREMGAYKASTLVDFERGQPLELEALFLAPWRQAQQAGAVTPRLAALCRLLGELQPA